MHGEERLIAYCGLFCGGCFSHTGKIADLARDLRVAGNVMNLRIAERWIF